MQFKTLLLGFSSSPESKSGASGYQVDYVSIDHFAGYIVG